MDHYDGDSSGPSDHETRGADITRPRARQRRSRGPGGTGTDKSRPCPRAREDVSSAHHPPTSPGPKCRTRKRHSLAEQQYRFRLNRQYEQLLDVLPADVSGSGGGSGGGDVLPQSVTRSSSSMVSTAGSGSGSAGLSLSRGVDGPAGALEWGGGGGGGERRVRKAEVLDRARLYIESLEREHRRLVAERRLLQVLWDRRAGNGGSGGGSGGTREREGREREAE
ncbi:hypothetical protein MFIFM68171_09580 [Madurella fahalii]|uniref:BHLH domain-containing protein n=1 Tax=Madurella fahalii TaxID=1157608 RepID=A0ABQ0GNP1_9PEZI